MSFVYPAITTGMNSYTNILFIDDSVSEYQTFVSSVNPQTLPVVYSPACSKTDLLAILANFTSISRFGFVFEINPTTLFLDNTSMLSSTEFLISIIRQFTIQNFDFLACNTLNIPEWKTFYDVLGQTGVIVGASDNYTGNMKQGGDWIMETTSQDIEFVYFTQSIEYYQYLLGNSLSTNSYLIAADGTIFSCGGNSKGQLGIGSTTDTSRNVWSAMVNTYTGLTPKMISAAGWNDGSYPSNVIVLMTNGTLWGCGSNSSGQLTNISATTNVLTQLTNTTGLTPIYVSCGGDHTLVIMNDGSVWGVGLNTKGNLGIGNTVNQSGFIKMLGLTGLTAIQVCTKNINSASYILCSNGQIYSCGDLTNTNPGNGTVGTSVNTSLIPMTMPTGNGIATRFSVGNSGVLVLMSNSTIWGCGNNGEGQLGLNNSTNQTSLQQMLTTNATNSNITVGILPVDLIQCDFTSYVLMSNGTVYGTGSNNQGQLSQGTLAGANTKLILMTGISSVFVSAISGNQYTPLILTNDGSIYTCGYNFKGALGYGAALNAQVSTLTKSTNLTIRIFAINDNQYLYVVPYPCFLADSKILTNKGYRPVQDLRRGDLIQTLLHGLVPIDCIGFTKINNSGVGSNKLYRCSPDAYPELFDDLFITGCHSILVDSLSDAETNKVVEVLTQIYVTDNMYRLPACVDVRAIPYEKEGEFVIYHFALEHADYYMNYGIYANGLLVETTSKRYMVELSNMQLI